MALLNRHRNLVSALARAHRMMEASQSAEFNSSSYSESVQYLKKEFEWNPWFLKTYWPENEPRVHLMVRIARENLPACGRALEVGCANGYVAYLFRLLGYDVAAVDAYEDQKRSELFRKGGITYSETNLNSISPLSEFPSASFDLVLLGEVFEHILNSPAGLLAGVFRVLRPGGLVILTTPNPSSIANAVRLLRDQYVLWGTSEFLRETKLDGDRIIDRGDIHYREYPAWVVQDLMTEIGFLVGGVKYVGAGITDTQSVWKRCCKRLLALLRLGNQRLFSPGYIVWAARPR